MPDRTIEPFQIPVTSGGADSLVWAAVARDGNGQVLRVDGATVRSGGHATKQAAIDAVTRSLTNHAA
ncbi:hypothetical protein SMD44_00938 [Streptomyces alboflavus]|uniref:Uncharacterized protein n=1 Tax=Streptomyces alboflavus TaxID=67267 RepID=A0A1Z1W556_9ACTN|nr:hypothetical protein [Streptomyces alboflavus]ARX81540.1 hypothetical protein SMD44_00938 [Streptomyces alboflavus]